MATNYRLARRRQVLAYLSLVPIALLSRPSSAEARKASPTPEGRPHIDLDRLELPQVIQDDSELKSHLLRSLKRESKKLDWGAGRDNKIEYRFEVSELSLTRSGDVAYVRCVAIGALPNGSRARSELRFGGDPNNAKRLMKETLDMAVRGVMARLAELERKRRGMR